MSSTSHESLPEILTVVQAAQFLGISRNTAYQAARRNEIPHARIGTRILINKHALLQMFDGAA